MATGMLVPAGPNANAALVASAPALDLARSIAADPSTVTGAAFVTRPPFGNPTALSTTPLGGFPRSAGSYAILTSGNALLAPNPNFSGSSGASNGGGSAGRGSGVFDVTVLRLDLDVPATANCLVGVDFQFLSDEYPEYVGSSYNDAFIAELDTTTWRASGSTISAPDNFAFDPAGKVISINAAGATSMQQAYAAGTTYDGSTPVLTAATPITPGRHSLYLSIFDQGDSAYDSAVFVDNLRFGTVANVARDCRPGAETVNRPRPLLGAHGITGKASDMNDVLGYARGLVPNLPTHSVDTGAITSVWTNGAKIYDEARGVLANAPGETRVNIIAHSKGGLDSRVAMWQHPTLFAKLGTLSTPHGGSKGADKICFVRRHGGPLDGFQGGFGPCDDDSDGVYNLQTSYMRDVFNKEVRDWNIHFIANTAGDCTGFFRIKCNAAAQHLLDCDNRGGDTAVCVSSAFIRDFFETDGEHFSLDPVFDADHTQMREQPCPTSRLMSPLYGAKNVGNPWREDSDGDGCDDLQQAAAGEPSSVSGFGSMSAPAQAAEPVATGTPGVTQSLVNVKATPAAPARLVLDPEGGNSATAEVFVPAGVNATVTVTDAAGNAASNAVVETVDTFGNTAYVVTETGLAGATRVITVSVDRATELGYVTSVDANGVTLATNLAAAGPGQASVEALVTGLKSGPANKSTVTATAWTPAGPVAVTLAETAYTGKAKDVRRFAAVLDVPAGGHLPVEVALAGPHQRRALTGVIVPDGSASFAGLAGDRLRDSDGDGRADTLAIDVNVTTRVADTYHLAVDLVNDAGQVVSAPGTATLGVGAGTITVEVPLSALFTAGASGPYNVGAAILSRGTDRRLRVAEAAFLGRTSAYDLGALGAPEIVVQRPAGQALDTDADSVLDTLRFGSTAWIPTAGRYVVEAALVGPHGRVVASPTYEADLVAGANPLGFDLDGQLVVDNGSGHYTLSGLRVTSVTNDEVYGEASDGRLTIDATRWTAAPASIAGLIERWEASNAAGEITNRGFFTSQHNRLERVRDGIPNRNGAAADELDRFIADTEAEAGGMITADAASRIVAYAEELRAGLPG